MTNGEKQKTVEQRMEELEYAFANHRHIKQEIEVVAIEKEEEPPKEKPEDKK